MSEDALMKVIKDQVDRIRSSAGDPEVAHSLEDTLYQLVVVMIAEGMTVTPHMAEEVLKSREIDFPRWCA